MWRLVDCGATTRRLPTVWKLRFYFRCMELNFILNCCKDDKKYYTQGVFTRHCQECTLLSSEYASLCVFTHWSAHEVCLMWPDAEKELLFRFQSLPKPHLGAMSHRRLLAVIDLRSGILWHCWKKMWLPNAVLLSSVYYPVKLITFIIFKAPQSGWKGVQLS